MVMPHIYRGIFSTPAMDVVKHVHMRTKNILNSCQLEPIGALNHSEKIEKFLEAEHQFVPAPGDNQGRTFNAILKYRAAFKVRLGRQQAIGQFNKFVPNSKIVENSLPVELPTALNSRPINPCHMVVHKLGTRYNMSHVAATIPQTLIIIININVTSYWVYSSSLTCKYSIVPDNSNKGE